MRALRPQLDGAGETDSVALRCRNWLAGEWGGGNFSPHFSSKPLERTFLLYKEGLILCRVKKCVPKSGVTNGVFKQPTAHSPASVRKGRGQDWRANWVSPWHALARAGPAPRAQRDQPFRSSATTPTLSAVACEDAPEDWTCTHESTVLPTRGLQGRLYSV